MKNNLLLLCFLAFAAGQGFAQKNLSAGVKHYGNSVSPHAAKIMRLAGFDLDDTGMIHPKSNVLQLDSTKTFFGYDPTGTLDSFPVFRTVYTYPQTGVRMEREYLYENGGWIAEARNTFFHDEQERLVEVLSEYFDPSAGEYTPDSRLEIFPRGNSPELIDSFLVYGWNAETGEYERLIANLNTFDEEDRLVETLSSFNFFGEEIHFRDIYLYDSNGDNFLIQSFAVFDDFEVLVRTTGNRFEDNRITESIEAVFNGAEFEPMNRITYAYTTTGALEDQRSYTYDPTAQDWVFGARLAYEYDAEDRLAVQTKETVTEEGVTYEQITYEYVQGENLALETTYIFPDFLSGWVLDSRRYFYYNTLTSVPEVPRTPLALQVAPNPTNGTLQVQLESDALVQVFDATGLLRRSISFQPGQTIDLDGLPAGVYYLMAKDKTRIYSNKVVKL